MHKLEERVEQAEVSTPGQFVFYRTVSTNRPLEFFIRVEEDVQVPSLVNGRPVQVYKDLPDKITMSAGVWKKNIPVIPVVTPSSEVWVKVTISEAQNFEYEVGKRSSAVIRIDPAPGAK